MSVMRTMKDKDFQLTSKYYSVSAPSATTFAYLGEFHSLKDRSKAIMLGNCANQIE